MPGRTIPLVTDEIYHVINRGISYQPIFNNKRDYSRAIETMLYYQNQTPPIKYSRFLRLSKTERKEIIESLIKQKKFLVEIISYCLMPNHFHLILKQITDNGISKFISNFCNSYIRYFNTKNKRKGPLLEGKFKAKRVETEEQLLHLDRYIHLNPYSSHLIKNFKDLENYSFSSFPEYLGKVKTNFCSKELILSHFKNVASYQKFIFDQADYQRELQQIKHLILE